MASKKFVNQKAKYRAHAKRLVEYIGKVQAVYNAFSDMIAKGVVRTDYEGTEPFRVRDYPQLKELFDNVQSLFVKDMRALIYSGTSEEWKQSNLVQDLLADKLLKTYGATINGEKKKVYYQTNSDALKAFQERRTNGMNLSTTLWKQSVEFKDEMECAISSAIEKGMSAVTLSKRLSKYLDDYPKLKKDYKEKFGQAVTCHDCEYRSIRVARSEINMAYRKAEQERWKQLDFVLGYDVKLTTNTHHVPDICDTLKGRYPKGFTFLGWHPNCMCFCVPVLKTEDQFFEDEEVEPIKEMPSSMQEWLEKNEDRISNAREKNTLPYFFTDNEQDIAEVIGNKRYRERTGRSGVQPVGNVEIYADRKYEKVENKDGSIYYRRYGTREEVRAQVKQWDEIQSKIGAIESAFGDACNSVVSNCKDIRFSGLTKKDRGSALRKADLKFGGDLSQCTDLVRCTFSCDYAEYEKVCNEVRARLKLKYDMSTAEYMHLDREDAYICRFMNPEFKNGIVGEIMVNPYEMVCAREDRRHAIMYIGEKKYLEIERKAKARGVELHRGHTMYEAARAAKSKEEAIKLYEEMQKYYMDIQSLMKWNF